MTAVSIIHELVGCNTFNQWHYPTLAPPGGLTMLASSFYIINVISLKKELRPLGSSDGFFSRAETKVCLSGSGSTAD